MATKPVTQKPTILKRPTQKAKPDQSTVKAVVEDKPQFGRIDDLKPVI